MYGKWAPWQTPERQTPERQTPERQTTERQTPEKTNSWRDKLLTRQTPENKNFWNTNSKISNLKKNVSQFIFNLAAALGPESVIT